MSFCFILMSNKGNIKAFTVVEAVISLIITAFIAAIVFVIFSLTSSRVEDFRKSNAYIADITRMSYALNKDIFENNLMDYKEGMLMFTGHYGDRVVYNFQDNFIVRQSASHADTFAIRTERILCDTVQNYARIHVYQRLQLKLSHKGQGTELGFYKKLYADQILNSYEF